MNDVVAQSSLTLTPFTAADYPQLIDWIDSDELNYLWGGPNYQFPLTVEQIEAHCAQPQVHPFLFHVQGVASGFIELYQVDSRHVRLCRIFIAHAQRGKGLASPMIELAIDIAAEQLNAGLLSLAVFEHNAVARHCYQQLGFVETQREQGTRSFNGHRWNLVRMEKTLPLQDSHHGHHTTGRNSCKSRY